MIEVENRTMEMLPYKNQIPVLSGRIRADRLQVIFSISYINAKTGRLIGTVALQNLEKRRMDTYELKAEHAGHLPLGLRFNDILRIFPFSSAFRIMEFIR